MKIDIERTIKEIEKNAMVEGFPPMDEEQKERLRKIARGETTAEIELEKDIAELVARGVIAEDVARK